MAFCTTCGQAMLTERPHRHSRAGHRDMAVTTNISYLYRDLVKHVATQYGFELTDARADYLLVTETAWPLDNLDETVEDLHAFFMKAAR